MGITGIVSSGNYIACTQAISSVAHPVATTAISLSTDTIDFAINGASETTEPSNALSLFSVLNANILDYNNLSDVGSAIDRYTKAVSDSNLYESSYTAPSVNFLHDLAIVRSAAALGNRSNAASALATAKLDAPDNVAGGVSLAKAQGDIAGETGLLFEGTANISDFLGTQGYNAVAAKAEANAITIHALTPTSTDPSTLSAQTRFQQISDLALYAADHSSSNKQRALPDSSDPLFNIISSLLSATSGAANNQNLAGLYNNYIKNTPDVNEETA